MHGITEFSRPHAPTSENLENTFFLLFFYFFYKKVIKSYKKVIKKSQKTLLFKVKKK